MDKIDIDRLSTVADILDEHFLEIYQNNHTLGFYVHWSAEEIRKVLKEDK